MSNCLKEVSILRFSVNCGALFIMSRRLDAYVKATICAVTMQKIVFFLNTIFFCPFENFVIILQVNQIKLLVFYNFFFTKNNDVLKSYTQYVNDN